jgi:hypothetical protein
MPPAIGLWPSRASLIKVLEDTSDSGSREGFRFDSHGKARSAIQKMHF